MSKPTEEVMAPKVKEEKDNIIIEIFKKLLEYNFTTYGGKKDILK